MDRLLDEASKGPLTIVTAGPGWGKTTSVASWVRRRTADAGRATWLTLAPGDDSPASFWDSVLTAIADSGGLPPQHSLSLVSTAGGMTDGVLLALLRGMGRLPTPLLLVLDDFHLISDETVMSALTDLVAYQDQVRVVLLTRVDPPLPLHRLRLSGAVAEVSASALAFGAAEVVDLATGAESLDLSPAEVQEVLARTEGWPTGVRLATMYLSRPGAGPNLEHFGGTDKSVAEYLVAEVLEGNTAEVRNFLLRTSIVDVVSGSLANALVPDGNGRARLESLEHANQFVVCVNPERTLFRYHPLLRDLLIHRLRRDIPEEYHQLHRSAADWYRAHGDPVRALRHAVSAADWPLAAEAFVEASSALVGPDGPSVRRLLQGVPFGSLPSSAALELCAAGLEYLSGHFHAMDSHVSRARRLLQSGDVLTPLSLALLENFACVVARARGDERAVALTAGAALAQVAKAQPGRAADALRSISAAQNAVALIRAGRAGAARAHLLSVVRDETSADVPLTVMSVRGHLAWCDLVEGDLYGAHAAARAVVDDAGTRGWSSQLQSRFAFITLAMAEMLWGNAQEADRQVAAGLAADVNGVEVWPSVALGLTQAAIAVSRKRPRAAEAALETVREALSGQPVSPSLADLLIRVEADVALLTGVPRGGAAPGLGHEAASPSSWSSAARLALMSGDLDAAQAAALRAERRTDSKHLDDILAAVEAALVLALVADLHGRRQEALAAVGRAVELAEGQGLVRPFLVTGSNRIAGLLSGVPVTARNDALVKAVLERLDAGDQPGGAGLEPEPLLERLTEREMAVLGELPTMRSNDEIAAEFYVSVNTVKSHLKHLYVKLGVTNRREAVRRAREIGLIP